MNMKKYIILLLFLFLSCSVKFKQSYIYERPGMHNNLNFTDSISQAWSRELKNYPAEIFNLNQNKVLIGDSRGGLLVLDLLNGKEIDRYWKDYQRPIKIHDIVNDVLFFSAANIQELTAWNLKKAELKWKREYDFEFDHFFELEDSFYGKHDRGVCRIDTSDGKLLKKLTTMEKLIENIVSWENKMLVVTESGKLKIINSNLAIDKTVDLGVQLVENLVLKNNILVLHNSSGRLKIFDLAKEELVFNRKYNRTIYSQPLLSDSLLIIPFADGEIKAINYKNNSTVWTFSNPELLNLDPVFIDRQLIVPYASQGNIVSLEQKTGTKIGEYKTGESIDYVKLTARGLLYSHHKKLNLIRNSNEREEN